MTSQRYILAPYVRLGIQEKTLYCGFGSIQQTITDPRWQSLLIRAAHFWKQPLTIDEVETMLSSHILAHEDITPRDVVQRLVNGHFVIGEGVYQHEDRYSRPWLYYNLSGADPEIVQQRLSNSHVIVLGCGGIGNFIATSLSTAGVGKLTLVDADCVELSNLTRQFLYTENDIGKKKIDVLSNAIRQRHSATQVRPLDVQIRTYDDFRELPSADLLVLSADKPAPLVNWVNQYAVTHRFPFLNVGYVQDIAAWGPFIIPGETGCWECQSVVVEDAASDPALTDLLRTCNTGYQPPSIGPINMLACGHALLDIFRYLGQFGVIASRNQRIGIWTHELRIERQQCHKNPHCTVCAH